MRVWTSFSFTMAPPRTSMLVLCLLSPATRPSLQQPAPAQVTSKIAEKDRYPHVNLVPFRPSSKTPTTHHVPSETLGQPSGVSSTAPSPNNNTLSSRAPWPIFSPVAAPLSCSRLLQRTQCQHRPHGNTYRGILCQTCLPCHVGLLMTRHPTSTNTTPATPWCWLMPTSHLFCLRASPTWTSS